MILGMSLSTFTTVHVVISLIGIASGFIVVARMLSAQRAGGWTAVFLATTVLTSVTGFMFPFSRFLPSHAFGVISLVVLAIALVALYTFHLTGAWRLTYVVTAVIALYLNVFVGVVQAFQKVPFLQPLAPTQSELPFLVVQLAVLGVAIALGYIAGKRFRPTVGAPASY
jgi:hypothetical protein